MSVDSDGPIILVGAGKMGGAMLRGWLARGLSAERVVIVDPVLSQDVADIAGHHGIICNPRSDRIPVPKAIVLAIKPQSMAAALADLVPLADAGTSVISIAAGWTIDNFAARFPDGQPIIRVMPNTPAAIGQGMLVACANGHVTPAGHDLCQTLMEPCGVVAWIDDEAFMDAVTAVSGSGPAYVFLLAECLEKAGTAAGLPAGLARELARVTVSGAGALLGQLNTPAGQLRANVTSPGGTTAAALDILMAEDGLQDLMTRAVGAATQRSRDLAN